MRTALGILLLALIVSLRPTFDTMRLNLMDTARRVRRGIGISIEEYIPASARLGAA